MPDSGTSSSCWCITSNVIDWLWAPKTLEVVHRHDKLAPESGVEFMATVSGACVSGLIPPAGWLSRDWICFEPYTQPMSIYSALLHWLHCTPTVHYYQTTLTKYGRQYSMAPNKKKPNTVTCATLNHENISSALSVSRSHSHKCYCAT